jgi:hypothetical protein
MKTEIMYEIFRFGGKREYSIVGPDDIELMDELVAEDAGIRYASRYKIGSYDFSYSKILK